MKTITNFLTKTLGMLVLPAMLLTWSFNASAQLSSEDGTSVNASGGGFIQSGPSTGSHLAMDNFVLQAKTNTSFSTLWLNWYGGGVNLLGSSGNLNVASGGMYFDNSLNRLGINTTTPDQALDVNGDIAMTDGTGTIYFQEGTVQKAFLSYSGTNLTLDNNEAGGSLILDAEAVMAFRTNGANKAWLDNDGNFGINTISPDQKLDVNGDIALTDGSGRIEFKSGDGGIIESFISHSGISLTMETTQTGGDIIFDSQDDMFFQTGTGANRMIINDLGRVGIGTTGPATNLEVAVASGAGGILVDGSGAGDARLQIENGGGTHYIFDDDSDANNLDIQSANDMNFMTNGAIERMTIDKTTGDVFVLNDIDITGEVRFGSIEGFRDGGGAMIEVIDASMRPNTDGVRTLGTSANRWASLWATDGTINTSDRRLKKNIRKTTYGIAEIMRLNPVTYNWKKGDTETNQVGLIAQELMEVIPEAVVSTEMIADENDPSKMTEVPSARLGVKYAAITPVIIKSVQQLQEQIDAKDAKIAELEAKFEALETLVNSMK